jgi:hypothetical protein
MSKRGGASFIDGDFPSGKGRCKYHCSPTCHPAQVGPEWKYGCLSPKHPATTPPLCPIVKCGGSLSKCEAKEVRT